MYSRPSTRLIEAVFALVALGVLAAGIVVAVALPSHCSVSLALPPRGGPSTPLVCDRRLLVRFLVAFAGLTIAAVAAMAGARVSRSGWVATV